MPSCINILISSCCALHLLGSFQIYGFKSAEIKATTKAEGQQRNGKQRCSAVQGQESGLLKELCSIEENMSPWSLLPLLLQLPARKHFCTGEIMGLFLSLFSRRDGQET